ncbi:MAG: TetR family transcriptional regulator [Alphaproteobacteria bacterium]|nr:TetR family transcriptional regulator [Alphaproteobacteria bacterium]
MADTDTSGRWRQRRRTRKALLEAAARLLREGRTPSLEEVADAAETSRATAYRYFPNADALLLEAALDVAAPAADDVFAGRSGGDAVARLEQVDAAFQKMMDENETGIRLMLAGTLQHAARGEASGMPARQNRRTPLIEAALAPARHEFRRADLDLLTAALALVIGTEAMIVFRDVLRLDAARAEKVRRFAIRALVEAARKERGESEDRGAREPRRAERAHRRSMP